MKIKESVIDMDIIGEYEKDTGKEWTETEERMAKICSFYDYGFNWNSDGGIVINNQYYEGTWEDMDKNIYQFFGKDIEKMIDGVQWNHYEYLSAKDMVEDWQEICQTTNADYIKNGNDKPFEWC